MDQLGKHIGLTAILGSEVQVMNSTDSSNITQNIVPKGVVTGDITPSVPDIDVIVEDGISFDKISSDILHNDILCDTCEELLLSDSDEHELTEDILNKSLKIFLGDDEDENVETFHPQLERNKLDKVKQEQVKDDGEKVEAICTEQIKDIEKKPRTQSSECAGVQITVTNIKDDTIESPEEIIIISSDSENETDSCEWQEVIVVPDTVVNLSPNIKDQYADETEHVKQWDKIEKLNTDQERYQQVREIWDSKSIPNPYKNLTYFSYRKRNYRDVERQPTKHKRKATSNLNTDSKRLKPSSFMLDNAISSMKNKWRQGSELLHDEKQKKVSYEFERHLQIERQLRNEGHYWGDIDRMWENYNYRVNEIDMEFSRQICKKDEDYHSEIESLEKSRTEMEKFCRLYSGLQGSSTGNSEMLSTEKLQELKDTEEFYDSIGKFYS